MTLTQDRWRFQERSSDPIRCYGGRWFFLGERVHPSAFTTGGGSSRRTGPSKTQRFSLSRTGRSGRGPVPNLRLFSSEKRNTGKDPSTSTETGGRTDSSGGSFSIRGISNLWGRKGVRNLSSVPDSRGETSKALRRNLRRNGPSRRKTKESPGPPCAEVKSRLLYFFSSEHLRLEDAWTRIRSYLMDLVSSS